MKKSGLTNLVARIMIPVLVGVSGCQGMGGSGISPSRVRFSQNYLNEEPCLDFSKLPPEDREVWLSRANLFLKSYSYNNRKKGIEIYIKLEEFEKADSIVKELALDVNKNDNNELFYGYYAAKQAYTKRQKAEIKGITPIIEK